MDAVVRKDAKKINKLFAGITQKIGENANIVDTRNVNSLREWRKNGSLVEISQEFKASNDGSLNNEKTEKRLRYHKNIAETLLRHHRDLAETFL